MEANAGSRLGGSRRKTEQRGTFHVEVPRFVLEQKAETTKRLLRDARIE
jgi:hypothetical protein